MSEMRREDVLDVLIVGGGPVGGCAGALLADAAVGARGALRVAVLEANPAQPPAPDDPLDPRVSALSRASERILESAGAWSYVLPQRVCAYERMRVWHESVAPSSPGALLFDAADSGEPNLGYIVENRLLQAAVLARFAACGGRLIHGELVSLKVSDECVVVETTAGTVGTRLVVGADGARSAVRGAIGLTAESLSYGQTAIVANVASERPHEHTAWQRFLSTGTIAFLPLADGTSSLVWSADEATASELLAAPAARFEQELERQSDRALGSMKLVTPRLSFPLSKLTAHRYTAQRCALIGDAAHVVHPLAGQGVNLGLLDAAALVELLLAASAEGEDPGALRVLRRYERWRKSETEPMALAIDGFNRFLAHGSGPLSHAARLGLGWVNRIPAAKRFFIARALGVSGELPRLARAPVSAASTTAADRSSQHR
jgi:2-octaprenylphenol hydroxylase